MNKIFGYEWEDIQLAQLKQRPLNKSVQFSDDIQKYQEMDLKLLNEHGMEKLIEMGYVGTVDRLKRSGY